MKQAQLLRIKEILKERGITSKDLAERLGVTPATISNINNGNHFPKPELLLKIAEVLDVDVRDLFQPTKEVNQETLYVNRGGKFIAIGEIDLKKIDQKVK